MDVDATGWAAGGSLMQVGLRTQHIGSPDCPPGGG
jgi:hypothetical protein